MKSNTRYIVTSNDGTRTEWATMPEAAAEALRKVQATGQPAQVTVLTENVLTVVWAEEAQ